MQTARVNFHKAQAELAEKVQADKEAENEALRKQEAKLQATLQQKEQAYQGLQAAAEQNTNTFQNQRT